MAVTNNFNLILVTCIKFLGSFVPGQRYLRVVDFDLTFKHSVFVGNCSLVSDVSDQCYRLRVKDKKRMGMRE